ncbi:MAG: hypothetical protein DCC68_15945, partial [Planctomycetota bacterium]
NASANYTGEACFRICGNACLSSLRRFDFSHYANGLFLFIFTRFQFMKTLSDALNQDRRLLFSTEPRCLLRLKLLECGVKDLDQYVWKRMCLEVLAIDVYTPNVLPKFLSTVVKQ